MPKTLSARLLFALIVVFCLCIIGRNLYRRHLNDALFYAVVTNNADATRALLDRGADANTRQPHTGHEGPGNYALEQAFYPYIVIPDTKPKDIKMQEEVVCLLITHGADIRENGTNSYLEQACAMGSVSITRCLLEHGAHPDFVDTNHNTALNSALDYGFPSSFITPSSFMTPARGTVMSADEKARRQDVSRELVRLLREHGARMNVNMAVQLKDAATLQAALASGADVNEPDAFGDTALGRAIADNDLATMRILLAHGANANARSKSDELLNYGSLLGMAAGKGNYDALALLLAHGANPNSTGALYASPLVWGLRSKRPEVARLLLARGAMPDSKGGTRDNVTPLSAAMQDLPELVPELVAHGADVNGDGGSPLRAAIQARRPDMVRYLLARGAKIYPTADYAVSPQPGALAPGRRPRYTPPSMLQTAVIYSPECFDLLIQAGATPGADKAYLLLAAARAGHAVLFDRLIALGANVNAATRSGDTPLSEAVAHAPQGIETLLRHGANPNVTMMGQTPLLTAVQTANASLTRLLLAHGADPNFKPPRGHTPLYFARRHPHTDILRLLEAAGAKAE